MAQAAACSNTQALHAVQQQHRHWRVGNTMQKAAQSASCSSCQAVNSGAAHSVGPTQPCQPQGLQAALAPVLLSLEPLSCSTGH